MTLLRRLICDRGLTRICKRYKFVMTNRDAKGETRYKRVMYDEILANLPITINKREILHPKLLLLDDRYDFGTNRVSCEQLMQLIDDLTKMKYLSFETLDGNDRMDVLNILTAAISKAGTTDEQIWNDCEALCWTITKMHFAYAVLSDKPVPPAIAKKNWEIYKEIVQYLESGRTNFDEHFGNEYERITGKRVKNIKCIDKHFQSVQEYLQAYSAWMESKPPCVNELIRNTYEDIFSGLHAIQIHRDETKYLREHNAEEYQKAKKTHEEVMNKSNYLLLLLACPNREKMVDFKVKSRIKPYNRITLKNLHAALQSYCGMHGIRMYGRQKVIDEFTPWLRMMHEQNLNFIFELLRVVHLYSWIRSVQYNLHFVNEKNETSPYQLKKVY